MARVCENVVHCSPNECERVRVRDCSADGCGSDSAQIQCVYAACVLGVVWQFTLLCACSFIGKSWQASAKTTPHTTSFAYASPKKGRSYVFRPPYFLFGGFGPLTLLIALNLGLLLFFRGQTIFVEPIKKKSELGNLNSAHNRRSHQSSTKSSDIFSVTSPKELVCEPLKGVSTH